ncbi:unnamed protein product [Caenorhabditis angaria]|uniref:Citron Rho-interacting kinase n=1 Tax=Caenorhabditis angaria TaxID=860376 RepID=A0A9P1IL39_9PELO|nr:unnamed protein product [Caenorhabditis angaria]
MQSAYGTPMSSTSNKTPRTRRRAISPCGTPQSPFSLIDLDAADRETLKIKLLEAEQLLEETRQERDKIHMSLLNEAGLDESIIVETSNRVSTQETKIYRRDRLVLEDELKQKQQLVGQLQSRITQLENDNQKLLEDLKASNRKYDDSEFNTSLAKERLNVVEEELRKKEGLLNKLQAEMAGSSRSVDQIIADFESEIQLLTRRLENATKALEQERKAKIEVEGQLAKLQKSLGDSAIRRSLEAENERIAETRKVLSEVQQLSNKVECLTPIRPKNQQLEERDELLKMSAKLIEENISDLKRRNMRLEKEVLDKKELLETANGELKQLREQLKAFEGNADQAARFLQDENAKLTLQKADIRCELLEVKRRLVAVQNEKDDENKTVEKALEDAKKREEELENQLEVVKSIRRKNDEEIVKMQDRLSAMKDALMVSDQQCSQLNNLKEAAEKSRSRAIQQCNEMVVKIRNLESALENQRKVEQELEHLRADNERQKAKIQFLNEEIQETHADYREELTKLAKENSAKKEQSEDYNQVVSSLKLQISQRESALRGAKKQCDEIRQDNAKLGELVADARRRQTEVVEENAKLRKGLADAVAKIEEYRRDCENAKEMSQRLAEELGEKEIRLNKMDEELCEKQQQICESEQVVNYLHSQINMKPKNQPKLGRRSTLLSTVSESVMDTSALSRESEEVLELENTKRELLRTLEMKRRMVDAQRMAETSTTTTTTTKTVENQVTTVATVSSQSDLNSGKPGTMRHDIPHKWKEVRHLSVLSLKCAICFVGISTFGKAKKCAHCDVQVHAACAAKVFNTCGMPTECANYYRENHTTISSSAISEGRMNGWLNVYRDNQNIQKWVSSWATMDVSKIAFYTNDGADLDKPYFTIDLNREQWVLRAGIEMPIDCEKTQMKASNVILIKMPGKNIYLLAPSQNSAKRWAECLQIAQRKRMMLTSRPTLMAEYTCLLVLNSPNNLKIYKSYCFDDWILFATQTGLFYTSVSQPRNPVRIAGMNSVTAMEHMAEINCLSLVTNSNGQLSLIPMDSLNLAMQSTQPSIRPDVLPEFQHCGIVKYHQQNRQRFLIATDPTSISILRYNPSRDVFCNFAKIPVTEPVVSIETSPNGIYFAADTFYFVSLENQTSAQTFHQLVPPKDGDYPLSCIIIGENELLLAYQNYGIFINAQTGRLSRRDPVEWEQMPMEFLYTAPHLFVIYYDSIAILEVAESDGNFETRPFLAEREVFECVNAHIIGRQMDSVLISVSSQNSTEVHRFNTSGNRRNVQKRRGISPADTLKRHKY